MFQLPAQPQSVGRTLDLGFRLYATGLKGILPLSAGAAFISGIPSFFMSSLEKNSGDSLGPALIVLGSLPFIIVGTTVLMVAMLAALDAVSKGTQLASGAALKLGLRKLFSSLGAGILYVLAILVGLIFLIVPGIILSVSLGLAICGIALENLGPIQSLKRSHRLIWPGHWWRTLTIFSLPVLLIVIIGAAVQIPLATVAAFTGDEPLVSAVVSISQMIASAFTTPIMYAMLIVLYHDLKLRREGGDLAQRISAEAVPVA